MLRNIRTAARTLRSWRSGAVVAVVTLSIGIGSASALYTVLRVAVSSTVPNLEEVARVGRIYAASPSVGVERTLVTLGDFEQAQSGARSFEAMAAYMTADATVGSEPNAETWTVTRVSPSFFPVLRARAATGRLFTAADFEDAGSAVLLGEGMWRRKFPERSMDDHVTVWLDGKERRVVGVIPAEFDFPLIGISGDAWIPMAGEIRDTQARVAVIARLRPGTTWTSASAELQTFAPPLLRDSSFRWHAIPVEQDISKRTTNAAFGTLVPALIVLIIACVNVSCMLLARGVQRDTELSIRAALGASRGAILRQLLTESMVLALAGGLGGAAVAFGALRWVRAILVPIRPSLAGQLTEGFGLLPIALAAAGLACLVFGALPAVRLSRRDVASSLKGLAPPSRVRVAGYGGRDLIVFFELGMAVVLLTTAAMWLSFFAGLQQSSPFFPAGETIVARIAASDLPAVTDRVRAIQGVERVTFASDLPGRFDARLLLRAEDGRRAKGSMVGVEESFFRTLGLPIVRGRAFDRTEAGKGAGVVVVSESVAEALWPTEDALGKLLYIDNQATAPRRVIGVSRNPIEFGGLGILTAGDVYEPLDVAADPHLVLLARARNASMLIRPISLATRSSLPHPGPGPMTFADASQSSSRQSEGLATITIMAGFALVALLLAGSGIFGVISETLGQRTHEFGVRMALGATAGRILRMVLARELKLIGAAMAAGALGTVAVTRTLFAELVTMAAVNPWWSVALTLVCGGAAVMAAGQAARRIVRLDPWEILRRT